MDNSIVSALGGGSGIDTTSLVKQLVDVQRAPQQQRLDSKKETLETQISAYGTLKSSLSEFQNLLSPLSNSDTFKARSVSIPDTTIITANTLAADAQVGNYQVQVEEVAQQHSLVSSYTASDKDAAAGLTGNLTIKLGAWTYDEPANPDDLVSFAENENQTGLTIEISADDSLQGIADKINAEESDVQATVLLVDGNYQLMMSSASGKNNALEVTADNTDLDGFQFNATTHLMTETQKGVDAEVKINGLSVFRETNEVDDVVPGLSFSLNKASPGEKITFSITEDKGTAEQSVRDFVEGYNSLFNTMNSLTGVTRDEENNLTSGDLSRDGSAKVLMTQIRNMIGSSVPGVDTFNALTNVGIRTTLDGTLEIIEDDFQSAMDDRFTEVAAIFAPQTSASVTGVDVSIGSYAVNTVPGTYSGTITTSPTKGSVIAGDDFAAVDTVLSPGDYTFAVTVNGTTTETLTLDGNFNTAEELRTELQSLINNDTNLKASNDFIDVVIEGDKIKLQSRVYGSDSKVEFSAVGAQFDDNVLFNNPTETTGVDAAGTINGEAAFGAGDVLLPKLDSDPYGLNLSIQEGTTGDFTFNFSRGFAGEMTRLIDQFLASDGTISIREDSINNQLTGIEDDQTELDRKMEKLNDRLTAQYIAMERIISSLQTTGSSLDGLADRLPFTASNN
ncbi:flagellar filament capping protein FliD [Amphritea balenae]|uniref:Flagellar hook-associated protein 2 n=1 Tax=Amphritea balenae TaxID=452629 RepID=A0A3P1SQ94_9GAMM|nr:flagellar filament capping protein FliD [Amphritea balenae]RRC99250.1 flagellar hook protein [Amphritea balenae]GGK72737.1 hypothetical protein GCM10007941_23400 [Amphritea balenae]